jgi:hypothetical protein
MANHPAAHPIAYASTGTDEQEVVIRIDPVSQQAFICACSAVWSRRIEKKYGPPARVAKNRAGRATVAHWVIPAKLIGFRRPRKPGSGNPEALNRAQLARKPSRLQSPSNFNGSTTDSNEGLRRKGRARRNGRFFHGASRAARGRNSIGGMPLRAWPMMVWNATSGLPPPGAHGGRNGRPPRPSTSSTMFR